MIATTVAEVTARLVLEPPDCGTGPAPSGERCLYCYDYDHYVLLLVVVVVVISSIRAAGLRPGAPPIIIIMFITITITIAIIITITITIIIITITIKSARDAERDRWGQRSWGRCKIHVF